jgi:hypothetical protein
MLYAVVTWCCLIAQYGSVRVLPQQKVARLKGTGCNEKAATGRGVAHAEAPPLAVAA